MSGGAYILGQQVWIRDVNEARRGGPQRGEVVKVGRSLVTVVAGSGLGQTFRIASGQANDKYGHLWLQTTEQYEQQQRLAVVYAALRQHGLEVRRGYEPSMQALEAVVVALDAATTTDPS